MKTNIRTFLPLLLVFVAGLVATTSCSKDSASTLPLQGTEETTADGPRFIGVIDNLTTRTVLSPTEGGYNLNWATGDVIAVTGGEAAGLYYATTGGSTTTVFAPVEPSVFHTEDMAVESVILSKSSQGGGTVYSAYYPPAIQNGSLPSVQKYAENNVCKDPMIADNSEDPTTFKFRQICGILKLSISTSQPDIKVRSISLSSDYGFSGSYEIVEGTAVVYGKEGVTLDCGEEGVAIGQSPTAFHLSVPSNRYSGLVIRILTTDNTMSIIRLQAGATYTVRRAELREINFTADNFVEPSWTDGRAELRTGGDFNEMMKNFVNPGCYQNVSDNTVKKVVFRTRDTSAGGKRIESSLSEVPIYMSYDNATATITVTTPADCIYANSNCAAMFENMKALVSVEGLEYLDTENTVTFYKMFNGCSKLKDCDLSGFTADNIGDTRYMFNGCSSITQLDLGRCSFSRVIGMQDMFTGMTSLQKLDLSSWDVRSLTDAAAVEKLFYGLKSLTEVRFGANGYNETSFRPSSFWCASSDAYSSRPGSKTGTLTIYCSEAGATWLANTNLRWVHSGYSGKTPVTVKFYDWQDNTKEYTLVWAAD